MSVAVTRLFRSDWRLLRSEQAAALVLAVLAVVSVIAALEGRVALDARLAEIAEYRKEASASDERTRAALARHATGLATPADASAGLPNSLGHDLLLVPDATSVLTIGESDLQPLRATLTAGGRLDDLFRFYQIDNPAQLAAGSLDLAFVVVHLVPLALLVLGFGVLATDRERGALAMLLSQPVSARAVAWTRLALRAGLVYGIVAIVAIGTVVDAAVRGDAPFDAWRLGMWLAGVAVYVAVWTALVGAVVATDLEADASALALVALWLVLTIVMPSLASLAARYAAPLPSRLELVTELRAAENAANARSRALLQGYVADHPELQGAEGGAVAPFVKTFFLVQRTVEAAAAPVRGRYDAQRRAQAEVVAALRYLSPALLAQGVLQDAAGTGPARYEAFRRLAVEERARWLAAVETPLMSGRRLGVEQYEALPRATVPAERFPEVARRVMGPAVALIVLAVALGVWAQRRLPRVRAQE